MVFGNISDIGVTSDDQLLVADADAKVIYVFSESGDSLDTFGRPGMVQENSVVSEIWI